MGCLLSTGYLCFCFVLCGNKLLDRTKGACSNSNTLAVDANGLEVYVLATLGGDVGVAAGMAENGALSAQLTNA